MTLCRKPGRHISAQDVTKDFSPYVRRASKKVRKASAKGEKEELKRSVARAKGE